LHESRTTPRSNREGRTPGQDRDTVAARELPLVVCQVVLAEHTRRDSACTSPHFLDRDHIGSTISQPLLESAPLRRADSIDVEGRDPHEAQCREPSRVAELGWVVNGVWT
jgi:hypothetical protein